MMEEAQIENEKKEELFDKINMIQVEVAYILISQS
jgi:hypothetical protein